MVKKILKGLPKVSKEAKSSPFPKMLTARNSFITYTFHVEMPMGMNEQEILLCPPVNASFMLSSVPSIWWP
jgi:hypothetical protein